MLIRGIITIIFKNLVLKYFQLKIKTVSLYIGMLSMLTKSKIFEYLFT